MRRGRPSSRHHAYASDWKQFTAWCDRYRLQSLPAPGGAIALPKGDRARLWLFGAARIEARKAASRNKATDELVVRLASELQAAPGRQPGGDGRDETLWLALSHLSARDREILALTAWEGLAPLEIAAVMGMSPNAVRVRLARARRALRARLEQERLQVFAAPVIPHSGKTPSVI